MLNDLFRTYKKIIILVLIILCMIIFWFYGCHRQQHVSESGQTWEEEELSGGGSGYHFQTDLLSGDVVFGTKGYLPQGRTLPVRVNVASGEQDFTGTLKITLPGADNEGVSYQSAVYCRQGADSRVEMEVPDLGSASYFYFEILDSFGTVVFSEKVQTRENEELAGAREIYVGVLSDRYSDLEYMDDLDLEINGEMAAVRLIRFQADDFPTDEKELGALSGMLIDTFDLSAFSGQQIECLTDWVRSGGSLFVGTGEGGEKVLPALEQLLKIRMNGAEEVSYSFSSDLSRAGSARLYSARLDFKRENEWESLSFSYPACVRQKEYGEGKISVCTFSLTDETFRQWTGREEVLWQIFHEELEQEAGGAWVEDASLWYIKKALYAFMNGRRPNTFYYGLFFIIYVGVLVFFAYYLLRKIKRREYIWGVVPVVAILFTASLAFRPDGGSRETEESFSAIRINDASAGQDDYYLLYQDKEGKEDSVDLAANIEKVEPVDYDYRVEDADDFSVRNITESYTINNTKNGFDIAFEESIPGTSYILKCSGGSAQTDDASCFLAEIQAENSYFEGTVRNISDHDFEKVVVIRGCQYAVLDRLDAGETVRVDESQVRFWTEYQEENNEENGDASTATGSLVEYLKQRYMMGNEDQNTLLVIGITADNDLQLLSGKSAVGNHLTAFVNRFAVPKIDDSDCIININRYLNEDGRDSSLRYNILEKNETQAVYVFDSSKLVWGLYRNRDGFAGSIYAYNYETQETEQILAQEDDYINCGQLEAYVSDMNEMTLTFYLPGRQSYGEAPILSLLTKDVEQ